MVYDKARRAHSCEDDRELATIRSFQAKREGLRTCRGGGKNWVHEEVALIFRGIDGLLDPNGHSVACERTWRQRSLQVCKVCDSCTTPFSFASRRSFPLLTGHRTSKSARNMTTATDQVLLHLPELMGMIFPTLTFNDILLAMSAAAPGRTTSPATQRHSK